jgi:hypothetical protein
MVKIVQWDFSLIINRAPHGAGLFVPTGLYFLFPVMRINLEVVSGNSLSGMIFLWLIPCLFGDTGIEPAELDL